MAETGFGKYIGYFCELSQLNELNTAWILSKNGVWEAIRAPWVKSYEESSDIRTWSTVGSYKLPALRKASWDAMKDGITTLIFCHG